MADRSSPHRRIAFGFVWVGFFVFIGKLAGAAKEMAIAWRYGVSETVDAYVLTFNIATLPVSLWFAVLTLVLLPLLAKLRHQAPSEVGRFQGELVGLTMVGGCLIGLIFWWGFPWLLATGALGLTGGAQIEASSMAKPLSLLLPMGVIISVLSAWLMAFGKHRNTLLEAIPALAILAALAVTKGDISEPLVWGTVAGFGIQVAMLAWPMSWREGLSRPSFKLTSPVWPMFWSGIGIMVIGQALMTITTVVDQVFAAHLDAGAISELSYANRIVSLLASLGAMAVSRSTLPVFADMIGSGRGDVGRTASRWSFLMFTLGLLVIAVSWIASPWIVSLLFERGSFTAEDSHSVSALLRVFLIHLPLYFAGLVLVSLLSAQRAYKAIYTAALLGFLGKCVALILLFPVFGLAGIALSTAVMYLASLLSMKLTLRVKVS
jgi:putative peptidoglycan lipid II flippase